MQRQIRQGSLVVPSILKYHRAVQLTALGQWWVMDLLANYSWWLEQAVMDIPLKELVLLPKEE